jgi:hypothetical protein
MSVVEKELRRRSTTSTTSHQRLANVVKIMECTLLNAQKNVVHLVERRVFRMAEERSKRRRRQPASGEISGPGVCILRV